MESESAERGRPTGISRATGSSTIATGRGRLSVEVSVSGSSTASVSSVTSGLCTAGGVSFTKATSDCAFRLPVQPAHIMQATATNN